MNDADKYDCEHLADNNCAVVLALDAELQEARRLLFWWHSSLLVQQFADVNDHTLHFLGVKGEQ